MPVISPRGFAYFRILYVGNKLEVTRAEVVVSGIRVTASALMAAIDGAFGNNYEDLIIYFIISFNSPIAGTLEEIAITVRGPTLKGVTPLIHFCSRENLPVPSGSVQITKRFIVRWYTKT
jgi:hypothetical protein